MEDQLLILHTNLKADGYDLPDYETFKSELTNPDVSLTFHENLIKDGYELPDYDTFLNEVGLKKKEVSEVGGVSANVSAQVSSEEQPPLEQPKKEEERRPILDALRTLKSGSLGALGGITGASSYLNRTLTGLLVRPIIKSMGGTDEDANMALDNIAMSNLSSQGVVRGAEMQQSLIKKAAKVDENIRAIEGTIWENIQKGDWGNVGELVMRGVMGSIPYLAMTAATAGGGSLATLGTIGATAASQRYGELEGTPEPKRQLNSALYGGFEAFGELITAGLLRGVGKVFREGAVKTIDGNFIKGASKEIAKNFGLEGSSEAWTQIGQNLTDILTGVDENKNVLSGVLDAFLIGGITGGGIGTAHAIAALTGRTLASDKEVSDVQENFKQQEVLINQLELTDVDPVKEALKRNIKFLKVQSDLIMDENYELAGKLTPEQQNQVAELYSVWNQLQDKIDSGQMTDVEAKAMQKTVEGIKGEIKAIKDDLIKRLDEEKKAEKEAKVDEVKETQKTELDKLKEEETKKLDKVKDVAEGETVNKKKLDEIKETFDTKAEEVKIKGEEEVAKIEEEYTEKEPTMEEAIAEENGQVAIPVNMESIDADVIYLIGNANNLTSAEKNILWRQWKRGVMSLGDIQKYTTVDLEKINRGEIDKWARVVLGINEREYNKKKYKKIPVDDVNFEEVTQPTPAKVEEVPTEVKEEVVRVKNLPNTTNASDNVTFSDWEQNVEVVETITVGGNNTRDVYRTQDGTPIYEDVFWSSGNKWATVDLTLPVNDVTKKRIKEFKGELDEEWGYTPDGFGLARFKGEDGVARAYNFIKKYKDTFTSEFGAKRPQELSPTKQVEEKPTKGTSNEIINRDYRKLRDKIGEKKANKYFEQVDKLINPNENNIVEYRENGVVTEKDGKYTFNALAGIDTKQWRIAFTNDVTDQFVKGEVVQEKQMSTELEQEAKVEQPQEPQGVPVEPLSTTEGITAPPKVESVAKEEPQETVETKIEEQPPKPPEKVKPTKEEGGKERERGYFKQLMESSVPSEELKIELKETGLTYRVLSNKETVANIDYVLSQIGFEKALEEVKDLNSAISWATRRGLSSRMVVHYDNIAMKAKEEGNLELAEEYLKKALDVADFVDKLGTATGQFNQYAGSSESFALLGKEANVKRTKKEIRKQRDNKLENNKEDVKEKRDALRDANKESVDEVIKSKEFDDLKKRVLELEKKLEERKQQTPPKEQPKEKIQKEREYREDQWKKFKEAGKKSLPSSIAGLNSEQIEAIGNIVASYVKEGAYRVEDIVARLKRDFFKHTKQVLSDDDARKLIPEKIGDKTFDEAIADNETDAVAKQLVKRVKALLDDPKIPKDNPIKQLIDTLFVKIEEKDTQKKEKPPKKTNAEKIAQAIEDKEKYRDVWEAAKEQVDFLIETNEELSEEQKSDQLKRLQSFFEEIIGRPYAERQVEGAVKEKIKDLGVEVDKIVRQHYTVADATGRSLSDKLIEELGLSGEDAELLAGSVQQQFNKIATARKRSILLQGIKARAKRISNPKQAKLEWQRLVELTNLGAFTNAEFAEAYADAWGFPKLTEQQASDLMQLAEKIQRKDGFKKDEAVQDYLNYIAKLPGLDLGEVALGVWYASILSGERTQFKNFFGNLANTISEMVVSMAYNTFTGNWSAVPFMVKAMWNAKGMAIAEGAYTMKSGYAPIRYGKIETGNYMERWRFRGNLNPLNAPKYVSRFMMAVDTFFYTGLKELRASEMAMRLARQENLEATEPSVSNWAKATEIMYGTTERRVEAELQADQEGLKGLEKKKRVWEIMERTRGEGIITESNNFASRGTYNYQPEGVVGEFTEMIGRFFGNRVFSVRNPATGKMVNIHYGKFFVPFTRIIANVANVALDYVPYVGAVRWYKGSIGQEGTGYYRKYTAEEKNKLLVKTAIGTVSMLSLALLSGEPDDPDEEPIVSITANGYGDYAKNEELKKSNRGFQPYSIKIGKRWYSYQYTPLFLALAPIGFIRDRQRLFKENKAELESMDYWMSLLLSPVQVLSDMTVLTSVAGLLGAITEENFSTFDSYWKKFTSGTAKGFIYPKVVEQTKQLVDDIANNPKHYSSSWGGKVLKDMPVLQNRFPIQYNSAGEEVIWDAVQMTEKATSDEYFQFLYENGVTIGAPRQKGEFCIIYDTEKKIERGMNDEEYMEFVKVSGRKIKERIMTEVVPKELSKEDNKKAITNIKTDVRRLTKEELFGWSDFRTNNPQEWQILRDNQAIQIPQSSVKDVVLGEEADKVKFSKEDIDEFNKRAMEFYAEIAIPTIKDIDPESKTRRLPSGETEYEYTINSLWTAAKQKTKAEMVEEKAKAKK